jgi:hypothetical protein
MIRSEAQRNESVRERLLEMLLRQKEKFAQYLDLLRREGNSIASGNAEQLQLQLDRENALITEIRGLRGVIEPLEKLYSPALDVRDESMPRLVAELEGMGEEMARCNAANRAALQAKMAELKSTIAGLRVLPKAALSPMASPGIVDVTA